LIDVNYIQLGDIVYFWSPRPEARLCRSPLPLTPKDQMEKVFIEMRRKLISVATLVRKTAISCLKACLLEVLAIVLDLYREGAKGPWACIAGDHGPAMVWLMIISERVQWRLAEIVFKVATAQGGGHFDSCHKSFIDQTYCSWNPK
jgi:hypothetical protein